MLPLSQGRFAINSGQHRLTMSEEQQSLRKKYGATTTGLRG